MGQVGAVPGRLRLPHGKGVWRMNYSKQPRHAAQSHAEIGSRLVFTVEQRHALREHLLRLAEEDERVVAGAAVGSLAVDSGDRFSDLDLTFGIADHVPVADVLNGWTRTLIDELDAVLLADLERGPTTYRVFLLPDALQFDLSMTPAAQFRPAGPRFRLLFGETAGGESRFPHRRSRGASSGGASSTRSTRARASSAGVSGRRSITSAPCATTRSRLPASARGCPRCRRAATTTFQQRRWLDSSLPTLAQSSLMRSGEPSPPPFSRSWARARRRVYRTRIRSRSASLSFADEAQLSPQPAACLPCHSRLRNSFRSSF